MATTPCRTSVGYSAYLVTTLLLFLSTAAIGAEPTVCFTPGGKCTDLIVDEIAGAKREVLVQAYSFTSAPIARALLDAKARGVDVRALLDKSQKSQRYTVARLLANAGIPVWIDDKVAIAHNKVIIIDSDAVITGSFNFTRSAQERNAENVLVLDDREIAGKYEANWNSRMIASVRYRAPGD